MQANCRSTYLPAPYVWRNERQLSRVLFANNVARYYQPAVSPVINPQHPSRAATTYDLISCRFLQAGLRERKRERRPSLPALYQPGGV
jgi:hypothetical protein